MVIRTPLRFEGTRGEKHLYALFDSGATYSCITPALAEELAHVDRMLTPMRLGTASSDTCLEIDSRALLDFFHDDIRLSDEFLVVPGLSEEVIIGAYTMQKWKLKLDFEHDAVIVDPKVAKLILLELRPTHIEKPS